MSQSRDRARVDTRTGREWWMVDGADAAVVVVVVVVATCMAMGHGVRVLERKDIHGQGSWSREGEQRSSVITICGLCSVQCAVCILH